MLVASWAQLAGTIFLGLVGLWLAYNYRRQMRLKLAKRQVDAYISLWKLIALAAHTRTTPLEKTEREKLYDEMTRWYHDEANGIFVSMSTRDLFLTYQSNLVCPINEIKPWILADQLNSMPEADADRRRGCISIRHATLLRNQLKNDLVLHPGFAIYYKNRSEDREFLKTCGLSPWRRPWRTYQLRTRNVKLSVCVCGMCPP